MVPIQETKWLPARVLPHSIPLLILPSSSARYGHPTSLKEPVDGSHQ
jgi:hypothetical protein